MVTLARHLPNPERHPAAWRERVADRMLAAEAEGGYGEFVLLRLMRSHRPGVSTLEIEGLDFDRYEDFLCREVEELRYLLHGSHEEMDDHSVSPKFSWHGCRWRGEEIELVVVPASHRGLVVAVGGSRKLLRAFADELLEFCGRPKGRVLVFSGNRWRADADLEAELEKVSWESVVLPREQEVEIRTTAEGFFARRDVYRSLGVAWRRGVLLVGPPGTGKTMICKAVAASAGEHPLLYVRDLASSYKAEDEVIGDVFGRARDLAPCILVFEDIDGFVNDRNRAVFLNELDGFTANDGMLVLATSNHPERVDEALLRRPSRFDRVFKIGLPEEAERERYCFELLSDGAGPMEAGGGRELAAEVARASEGLTPAHLKEAILGAALELAHGVRDGEGLAGEGYARAVLGQVEKLKRYAHESKDPERLAESRSGPPGFRAGRRRI